MILLIKKLTLCVPLLLLVPFAAFSQDECDFPGPSEIWVNETTTTSIEIEWAPVPGVTNYEVTTIEVSTGSVVQSEVVSSTVYEVQQLTPGETYDFQVTSLCDDGSSGGTTVMRAKTSIIIVDIVMHLECPTTPNNPTHGPFTYLGGNTYEYLFVPTNVLLLKGHVGNGATQVNFELVFSLNPGNLQLTSGTTANFGQQILFVPNAGNGMGQILYLHPGSGNWTVLGDFTPVHKPSGSRVEITWNNTVNLTYTNCGSVRFGRDSGGEEGGGEEEGGGDDQHLIGLELGPNPALDQVRLKASEATPVEVYDLQGRTWHRLYLEPNQTAELDISQWPQGMYVLRYFLDQQPQTKRFIKN